MATTVTPNQPRRRSQRPRVSVRVRERDELEDAGTHEKEYDLLNFRDDQFDMSEAFMSIAIAVAAVASLVGSFWLLYVAWGSGAIGVVFWFAGFSGLNFRPEWLAQLLGT